MSAPLRLGVSACLLGDPVRWNGDHQRHDFLVDVLGPHVEWTRVCPEVEIGLGVPREPIQLLRAPDGPRLIGRDSGRDLTATMNEYAARRVGELAAAGLDGFVLKHRSPSCGLSGVRLFEAEEDLFADGAHERSGRGLFASALVRGLPHLPAVEESQLDTRAARAHFVERLFAERRLRELFRDGWTPAELRGFRDRHELQVLARSASARRTLHGIAERCRRPSAAVARRFREAFSDALARPPKPDRVVGVMRRAEIRIAGAVEDSTRRAVAEAIEAWAAGDAALDDARAVLAEAAAAAGDEELARESFLSPDPRERAILAADAARREVA